MAMAMAMAMTMARDVCLIEFIGVVPRMLTLFVGFDPLFLRSFVLLVILTRFAILWVWSSRLSV
jgi:hypothetical protein